MQICMMLAVNRPFCFLFFSIQIGPIDESFSSAIAVLIAITNAVQAMF